MDADRVAAGEDELVAAARGGDVEALGTVFERHRRELQVHCYRMMGSVAEAEDLVQVTFERAMRGIDGFEGTAPLRAWLYRIATNACLDELRRRQRRRVLPFDVLEPVRGEVLPPAGNHLWLEPYPDRLLPAARVAGDDPGDSVVRRETIDLLFMAAIQHLTPRQRAVFIARAIMGWSARATATLLDTNEAAVKSMFQRARTTMRQQLPARRDEWGAATEVTDQDRAVLQRYIDAHQRDDIEAMAEVLAEDVRVAYPQIPLWSDTRDAFVRASREFAPPGEYRFVPTSANLQPAVAIYLRPPGEDRFGLTALEVLRIEAGRIVEIVDFDPAALADVHGLAPTLG